MDRSGWVEYAARLARPVLRAAAEGRLEDALAAEHHADVQPSRLRTAPLEAMGRLLSGLGPWFDAPRVGPEEARLRDELADLARRALVIQSDPDHPAYLRFRGDESQTLVDAAFLAQGVLRAPSALWANLDAATRTRLQAAMVDLRNRKPHFNNWLLFAATTEAMLHATGAQADLMRIDYALRQHEQWYAGDGTYSDGPEFHFDYYNSYVIHPMITDTLRAMAGVDRAWDEAWETRQRHRLTRAAEIQERLIAPDGSFPAVGRSICYRCGAFQTLAQAVLLGLLPGSVAPGQVRAALSAVIERTLGPAGSWRDDGFLWIGLSGRQPSLGEAYITTGSLYLAACAFLPLGLAPEDGFWTDAERPWTSVRLWSLGEDLPADHALRGG